MQGKSNKLSGEIQSIGGPTPFLCIFIYIFLFLLPQGSITNMPIALFPTAQTLHWRTKQWEPGGDRCLTGYGSEP